MSFNCTTCNFVCKTNGSLKRHYLSRAHINKLIPSEYDATCEHQCQICFKIYTNQSSLWSHKKKCKKVENVDVDLSEKINKIESLVETLVKNQQPSVVNNIVNNNNITNININIFLNNECKNACTIEEFIDKIQFDKVNYNHILDDYAEGNMEVICREYHELPEFERPLYCFLGDEGKAYIKYNTEWIMEDEKSWIDQIKREQNDINDEPVPNSMYSLVRMFDKKKMEYFYRKWTQSNSYKYEGKINKDCYNAENQHVLVKKLITMATIPDRSHPPLKKRKESCTST